MLVVLLVSGHSLILSSLADASLSSSVSIQQLVEQTLAPEVREKRCEQCGHETATTTTQVIRAQLLNSDIDTVMIIQRLEEECAC